jgi:hypothetical protein
LAGQPQGAFAAHGQSLRAGHASFRPHVLSHRGGQAFTEQGQSFLAAQGHSFLAAQPQAGFCSVQLQSL